MKKLFKFRIDEMLLDDLFTISKTHNVKVSQIIRLVLTEYINTYKENNYKR